METRPYFIFGDIISVLIVGALCGLVCSMLFNSGWNMVVAMCLGMAIGMVLSFFISAIGLSWLFGAMEIMVPAMLAGMFAAMAVSMETSMHPVSAIAAIQKGGMIGLVMLLVTYILNGFISGKQQNES